MKMPKKYTDRFSKMTKISLYSRICGLSHTVTGRIDRDRIIVEIETPCEKFRDFTSLKFPLQ